MQTCLCGLQMFVKADLGKRFFNSRAKLRFRAAAWPAPNVRLPARSCHSDTPVLPASRESPRWTAGPRSLELLASTVAARRPKNALQS